MPECDLEYYQSLARALVGGKKVIIAGGVLARSGPRAAAFRELGAQRPFLLASGRGTGPQPTADEAECFSLDVSASTLMDEIRATERKLLSLPNEAVAALDAYDPDREAIVLGMAFSGADNLAGRRVIGARPRAWEALEDKVVCDEVWDAAGIARAPYEVVSAELEALNAAARRMDRGDGTVWAGDASEGFNGGADYVRWVRRAADRPEAESFFAGHTKRVRVMPFLEGIPTSIHGFVHGGGVAVFRPVELLTLRTPTNRFRYAGTATYWDPPDADREDMRSIARRVADELQRRVGYRGGFTIDGVLTTDGFRPTELNSRFGAGMGGVVGGLHFPLNLIQVIAIEDPDAQLYPDEIERIVLEHADATRAGGSYTLVDQERTETQTHPLVERDGGFAFAPDTDDAVGDLLVGPASIGGLVSYQPVAEKVPVGQSFAPTVVRAFAFADEHLGTELGPLEAARSVR
jgi:hypothetical protein